MLKKCVVCEREFEAYRETALCCSQKCYSSRKTELARIRRGAAGPVIAKCQNCGADFLRENPTFKNCSPECVKSWKNRMDTIRYYAMDATQADDERRRKRDYATVVRASARMIRELQSKGIEALL